MSRFMTLAVTFALANGCATDEGGEPMPETPEKIPSAGTCDDPVGTIRQVKVAAEVEAMVLGRWEHCSGRNLLDAGDAGFQFDADGTYFVLVRDGDGLVRKEGFAGQGTWNTYQEESSVGLYIHPTPNSGTGGYPVFAENPRKMSMLLRYQTEPTIYAWIGE